MTRNDVIWATEFLRRVVPRGFEEEEALVRLIRTLEQIQSRADVRGEKVGA